MEAPEYLICLNCESPCYVFEWQGGQVDDVLCTTCGSDDKDQFMTEEDFEALGSGDH